jgi:hypothetical protein
MEKWIEFTFPQEKKPNQADRICETTVFKKLDTRQ